MIKNSNCFQIEQHDPVLCLSEVIRMQYIAQPEERQLKYVFEQHGNVISRNSFKSQQEKT